MCQTILFRKQKLFSSFIMFKILQLQTNLRDITFAKTLFREPSDLTIYTPCGQQLWALTIMKVWYGHWQCPGVHIGTTLNQMPNFQNSWLCQVADKSPNNEHINLIINYSTTEENMKSG